MSIEVKNLAKQYGEQWAVNHISFKINKGEIVGFLGPNGAGKSTTMKMICGHVPPTTGNVWVDGLSVEDAAIAVKNKIGYLPESNPLYMDMYVKEYLDFVKNVFTDKQIPASRIDEVIEMTGLKKEVKKKISMLSKGYKQRVGLARTMLHDPEVLILDEPTSGLDPNQIVEIRDLITEIGKQKTVLLSTHIMQEVEAICHRAIILDAGKIVADNTLDKLSTGDATQIFIVKFSNDLVLSDLKHSLFQIEKLTEKTLRFSSNQNLDLRKEIMKWSIDNDLTIDEMSNESKNLENIFRTLTKH